MSHGHGHEHPTTIIINNKEYKAPNDEMTGLAIKQLATAPDTYLLVEVVPGGEDKNISDNQIVNLKNGMHFRVVNPPTFG